MVNYQLGKIYKLVCNKTGLIYVGSTCEPTLARRLANHKNDYNQYLKENRRYVTSFEIIKNGDCDIVLLESYPCETKDELHKRERYYIETLECINKCIPTRTDKEYYDIYYKNYYEKNKKLIYERKKLYYEKHKEKLKDIRHNYYEAHKEERKDAINKQHREYYEANKEEINKKHKQYYEAHKDEINKKNKELRALKKQQQQNIN